MSKIVIDGVADEVFTTRGFREKGCLNSSCKDACCRQGCDVDKESYELILLHREQIETMLGFSLEECFETRWSDQTDFLGNNSISSTLRNGTCPFHLSLGKGCVLWQMVTMDNRPRRMIPSTCRLYPITWEQGVVRVVAKIESNCSCVDPYGSGALSLWETQKEAIEDIFLMRK
jgi:hypothetical protein